ncbi:DUF1178 family protein [Primorskyibacter aestuariivivens]|uniref:DUF1178 family protein n=1 Tax=Primorskyibacter aestuariivivens TaxID=1888912 RepID=UPI0023016FA2|nr:DUF1178 family protein [Primorskyibacter aestuariivivens]MDA7428497.1 DUF1178 family protein [Primorskyibacter aestuariivivens]
MINYALKCDQDHRFESWFQSADAFDKLKSAGMVSCAVCGSTHVDKAIMSPRVSQNTKAPARMDRPLSQPASPAEQALAELKAHVEKNSDYVGRDFVKEARAMHEGSAPERAIHGEARPEEARKLIEDGVPVAPLPFRPNRKSN